MNTREVNKILRDTSYIRTAGSKEEKKCAEYIKSACEKMGLKAKIEPFSIPMYETHKARLVCKGREFRSAGYLGAASETAEGKLYYLRGKDSASLKKCKDKIVLVDNGVSYKLYDNLIENGAKGFITYSGNACFRDKDIDIREIRFETNTLIPAVNIHAVDAIRLAKAEGKNALIELEQTKYVGTSHNVILDIKGESEETVIISAHYDSVSLSKGAYDNMSSCISLLYLAEYFAKVTPKKSLRFLWCGAEERGLLGSIHYCRSKAEELKNIIMNINLDMLGSALGEFSAFCCADEKMEEKLQKFFKKHRFPASVKYAIRSSDSNSFVFYGIPAVSFARYAPSNVAPIHTRYDTAKVLSAKQLLKDSKITAKFIESILNIDGKEFPFKISQKIKEDVENYMERNAFIKGEQVL